MLLFSHGGLTSAHVHDAVGGHGHDAVTAAEIDHDQRSTASVAQDTSDADTRRGDPGPTAIGHSHFAVDGIARAAEPMVTLTMIDLRPAIDKGDRQPASAFIAPALKPPAT